MSESSSTKPFTSICVTDATTAPLELKIAGTGF